MGCDAAACIECGANTECTKCYKKVHTAAVTCGTTDDAECAVSEWDANANPAAAKCIACNTPTTKKPSAATCVAGTVTDVHADCTAFWDSATTCAACGTGKHPTVDNTACEANTATDITQCAVHRKGAQADTVICMACNSGYTLKGDGSACEDYSSAANTANDGCVLCDGAAGYFATALTSSKQTCTKASSGTPGSGPGSGSNSNIVVAFVTLTIAALNL